MEFPISENLFILSMKPDKGGFYNGRGHLRLPFTGAIFLDFYNNGELRLEDKKVIHECKTTGSTLHDSVAEILKSPKNFKRVSYWIRRLSMKFQFMFRETGSSLEKEMVVRVENRRFLGIIPWRQYYLKNKKIRMDLVEQLRAVLLHQREPEKDKIMLIAMVKDASLLRVISRDRHERKKMRARIKEITSDDEVVHSVTQAIRHIRASAAAAHAGA